MIKSVRVNTVWKVDRVKPVGTIRIAVGHLVNVMYKDETKARELKTCQGEVVELDSDYIVIMEQRTPRKLIELCKWQIEDIDYLA